MSGTGGGGGGSRPRINCDDIEFRASINSPQPDVLEELNIGDVLSVQLNESEDGVVVYNENDLVGALTGSKTPQLIECLLSDYEYQATVISLMGGQCMVDVEAV